MKNELISSLQECKIVDNVELNERTQSVTNHEQAIPIIKDYELVIRSKEKGILNVAYRQGLLFGEFDSNKFEQMLQEIEVSKLMVYFKVTLVKLLDKHPKIKCLSLSLIVFKHYAKTIKEACKESGDQFKQSYDL